MNNSFVISLELWTNSILQKLDFNTAHELAEDILLFSKFLIGFPVGVRAENIEIVIAGYQIAGEIFWNTKPLANWATTQYNLGNSYCERIRGNKPENLELAIHHYLAALTVQNKNESPKAWALTKNSLGTAYIKRIKGKKSKNIELGIECFNKALTIHISLFCHSGKLKMRTKFSTVYISRI